MGHIVHGLCFSWGQHFFNQVYVHTVHVSIVPYRISHGNSGLELFTLCFVSGHYAADEIKEKIDDLDQRWVEFKVRTYPQKVNDDNKILII